MKLVLNMMFFNTFNEGPRNKNYKNISILNFFLQGGLFGLKNGFQWGPVY